MRGLPVLALNFLSRGGMVIGKIFIILLFNSKKEFIMLHLGCKTYRLSRLNE